MKLRPTLGLCLSLMLAGCGGDPVHHHDERFANDPRHRREFATAPVPLCEAVRHVLLGQGYLVARQEEGGDTVLLGQKEFREKETRHTTLQVQAVCARGAKGGLLFVTAVENRFDLAQTQQSTSLDLPLVAPVSIATHSSSEGQLKLSGETVDDRSFYDGFFKAVDKELGGR